MWRKFWKQYKKVIIRYLVVLGVILIGIGTMQTYYRDLEMDLIEKISYPEFLELVDNGAVDTVYYSGSDEWMTVTLWNEESRSLSDDEREDYHYAVSDKRRVLYPAHEDFRKELLEKNVTVKLESGGFSVWSLIGSVVTLAFPVMLLILFWQMMRGQARGLSESELVQESNVKFDNVIGQDEILDDVKFIVSLIKNREIGEGVGAKVPKGILFSGEPGTGKTLIAKAIAGEAGVPFLYVNSSSLVEMYVGLGAKRVRDLFKIAKDNAPCVLFFDEIDAIGCSRDSKTSHSEYEQTVNALLQEMDGFTGREGVFVIAATNRADQLDSALVRSGRFDRQVVVNRPRDWRVRCELFKYYLGQFKYDDTIDIEVIAKQVSGFTGADIAAVCNEASLIAVMKEKRFIDMESLEEAIDKKVFKSSRAKDSNMTQDKEVIAYHEAGHAVLTYLCGQPISRASIISMVSGVGGAVFGADPDSNLLTDKDLSDRVMIAYAGRASEEIKYGVVTTGASNDITQATNIMLAYIEKYGFDKEFGLLDMGVLAEQRLMSGRDITDRLSAMSKRLYNQTVILLKNNYNLVEKLAEQLLQDETLTGKQIEELLR